MAAASDSKDIYNLKGKSICGNEDFFFNDVYSGKNRIIYSVCNKITGECDKVLAKVYKIKGEKSRKVDNESKYLKKASDLGITPSYIGTYYCKYDNKNYGIILFEHFGEGTVTDLIINGEYERNKRSINKQLKDIIDLLYSNKIDHNDMHTDNFLYKKTGTGHLIKIIDFDQAKQLKKMNADPYEIFKSERIQPKNWWRTLGPHSYIHPDIIEESETIERIKGGKKVSKRRKTKKRKTKTKKSKTLKRKK